MERTELDSRKPKLASYWGVTRDDGVDIGHSEYITRLTALRDSLMDQEQVYLVQALDRLRIHSLTNKSSTYRLRMIHDEIEGKIPLAAPRKSMQTTVEKFRQMRIKPHHPSIFPIQGTQLLEQKSPRKGNNKESKKDNPAVENSHKPTKAKIDESIQANLQRLLQPRSSIPNIGRKAIKQHENLEVKPKPFSNIRSRVYKNTGKHPSTQVVQFYLSPTDVSSSRDLKLYGSSPGQDPGYVFLKEETVDIDTVRGCNYDSYLVPPSSREPSSSDSLDKDNFNLNENSSSYEGSNVYVNVITTEGNGIETTVGDLKNRDKNSSVPTSSRNVISVYIPNNTIEDINGYSFCSSDEEPSDVAPWHGVNKKQAPGKEILKVADRTNGTRRYSSPTANSEHNGSSRIKDSSYRGGRSPGLPDARTAAHGKRHTDGAPSIILNPGTPDMGLAQRNKIASGQKTTLEKAVKQKELRQRELENLFDDVRELNMNIDQYSSRSVDTIV